MIQLKRAYEPKSKDDGFRVLVDRLWPRGIKKENLFLHAWIKELAPSTELRKEFGHNPRHWKTFQSKYKKELRSPQARKKIKDLIELSKKKNVTLLYGARDKEHNEAVVLKKVIEKELMD